MSGGERVIKRAKSATARLTSAKEPAPPTKERSLSAREVKELTRQAQESSAEIKKVFPRSGGIWKSYSWGRTSYSSDFGPKSGHFEPAKARPSSRTRRNNPHPNQSFLQWRIPVRLHGNRNVVAPSKHTIRDAQESFYDDYLDHTRNMGEMNNEPVITTNLAKIPFPVGVAGMKLQLNSRTAAKEVQDTGVTPPRPVSAKQSRVISHTVKEGCVPVFKEWLDTADPDEKKLVLDMLRAGTNKEMRIQRAAEELLQPDVLPNIQDWLSKISDKEQHMLVNILETLTKVNKQPSRDSSHSRSSSYPPNKTQFQWAGSSHASKLQQYSRYYPPQPKPRPHSATPQE